MYHHHMRMLFQRLFIIVVFLCIVSPFAWCLLISLQGWAEVNSNYAIVLPEALHVGNYMDILRNGRFASGLLNSLIISLISVVVNLIISVPAGFALARVKTPLTKFFFRMLLTFSFMPMILLAVPMRDMLRAMGLSNTHLMVALPMSALVITVMMFWQFYARFPKDMDDCATMMGLTPIGSFIHVYLPVSGRMMVYAAIMQFVTTWSCAFFPMFMYRGVRGMATVQYALLQFTLSPGRIYLGMAAAILACLPCWLLYVVRYRMKPPETDEIADPFRNSN